MNQLNYTGLDMSQPINQWQKAIESRDANEVARLLELRPEFANTKIMDRYRDGRLNPEDHHQEALDHVARTGHVEIAKLLVEAGANEQRIQGAFMIAEPNVAEFLLEHCDSPKPDVGLMAYIGKWEAMKFWFDRGYKPETQMLHDACCGRPSMRHFAKRNDSQGNWKERHRETVRVLIEAGVDVNEKTDSGNIKWGGAKPWRKNGETPLHIAATSHDVELIQMLLNAGADKTLKNDLDDTPCCWAIRYLAPPEVIKLLDFEGNTRRNPEFWWAAHQGKLDEVKEMIEAGADPNAYEENGMGTLLNFHPEVTKYLIEQGANPDLQRNENIIPVLVGVAGFNTECVKVMLEAGANPNIVSEHNNETALHHSVCGDRFEEVKALLDAGANPNERTHDKRKTFIGSSDGQCHGETCLHRAAGYGTLAVIKLLLENGAKFIKDADGLTPLDWAVKHNRENEIIALLEEVRTNGSGGNLARTSTSNLRFLPPDHPFIVAVREVDLAQVKKLIGEDKVLVNASVRGDISLTGKSWVDGKHVEVSEDSTDRAGPLHFAAFHGIDELAQVLIEMGADINASAAFGGKNEVAPVTLAAWEGNIETLKVILDAAKTANVELQLQPALFTALAHRSKEKADLLVEYGAQHDLFTAAMAGECDELERLIKASPDSINQKHPEYDRSPLEQALKVGQTRSAEILAANGAEVTLPSAAAMGRIAKVKAALADDAGVALRHYGSYPLLIWAIHQGQVEMVKLLFEYGADPNGSDRWGYSPLSHIANVVNEDGAAITDLFLAAGADVTKKSSGKTPIDWALENKNKFVHQRLIHHIENNVDLTQVQETFWKAVNDGDIATVKALLAEDASLASIRFPTHNRLFYLTDGYPLHVAARAGNWELAKVILEHGVDPDAKRDLEEIGEHRELGMPLHYAVENGNFGFANRLLDCGATPSGHPYCAMATIEQLFYQVQEVGVPELIVRRAFAKFLPDQEQLESQTVSKMIDANSPKPVKLFARMADLGGQLPFSALVRGGFHDLAIEIIGHCPEKEGTPHDYPNSTVLNNVFGSSRWFGYPELLRRVQDHENYTYSYESAIETIGVAIGSHNRDGDYSAYREIIVMQLEALKANGDLERAQADSNFQPLYHMATDFTWDNNYGYRAEIAKPESYVDLAELFVSWGLGVIEYRDPKSNHSPLSAVVNRGSHPGTATYARWLLENGADLRQSDPADVNPIAIAKAKGLDEIGELLKSYQQN